MGTYATWKIEGHCCANNIQQQGLLYKEEATN